jgi:hypothetical protein
VVKNPDASMEAITFEHYMTDGPHPASHVTSLGGGKVAAGRRATKRTQPD